MHTLTWQHKHFAMEVGDNQMGSLGPDNPPGLHFEKTHYDDKLYKSVVDRYYTKRYKIDDKNGEDICILEHSNRVCLITLAPSHPIIKLNKIVEEVCFKIDDNVNRSDNKVTGRLKRGAQWLNASAILCKIKCSDGSVYDILPGIKANLIEINENLMSNPKLIVEKPCSSGYIAILLTKHDVHDKEISKLMTEEKYLKLRFSSIEDQGVIEYENDSPNHVISSNGVTNESDDIIME